MSRVARTQNSVSLFPFLAVLVCAMGALIFLLLVTTRRIREDARRQLVERAPIEVEPESGPAPAPVPPEVKEPELQPITVARTRPFVPPHAARLPPTSPPPPPEPRPEPVLEPYVATPPPPDPNVALRREIASLEEELAARRARAAGARETIDETDAERAVLEADVQRTLAELVRRRRELDDLLAAERALASRKAAIEEESASLGERLRRARGKPDDEESKFAFVPYDGTTGTNRRPVYIECTKEGLRFLPEGLLLTEADLVGFTHAYNPLLAGTRALVDHWDGVDRRDDPASARPYVLLLVRPGGAGAYYAARTLLQRFDETHGYEIVPEDFEVALPEPDPVASRLVRDEVNRLIAHRNGVAAAVTAARGRRGGGGSGGVPGSDRGPIPAERPLGAGGPGPPDTATDSELAGSNRSAVGSGAGPVGIGARPVGLPGAPPRVGLPSRRGGHLVRDFPVPEEDEPRPSPPLGTKSTAPANGLERDDPASNGGKPWSGGLVDTKPKTIDELFPKPPTTSPFDGPSPDDVFERATRGHPSSRSGVAGGHPAVSRAGIGIEKPVVIDVHPDRLIVNDRYSLPFERGQSSEELARAVVQGVEATAAGWGHPPRGFHWVPTARFRVHPGGNVHYERVRGRLRQSRLKTSVVYKLEASPDAAKP